jgi:hypothetical protein
MESVNAQIIVSVPGHWLIGTVPSNGERIQDILRDKHQEFIHLNDAQIYRPANREWCRAALSKTIVPRQEVEFVILPGTRHEAPIKRYHNFTVRQTAGCLFTIRQYCIQGEVHVPSVQDDVAHTFVNQLVSFFPVTNACLNAAGIDQLTAPVLFANKQLVSCFHLGALVSPESPATAAGSPPSDDGLEEGIDRLLTLLESYRNESADAPPRERNAAGLTRA